MSNYYKNKLKDRLTYCKSWKHDIDMYLANNETQNKLMNFIKQDLF